MNVDVAKLETSPVDALRVEHVTFAYTSTPVLKDVSFRVAPGRFAVLLGLNGAGKSTLFALLTRLFACRQGSIMILGHDIGRQTSQSLAGIGVVFQQPTLDLDLSVMDNLRYHGALHGLPGAEVKRRAERELDRVGMLAQRNQKARHLSGGMRRRVEIARALLHRPRFLLLDEPTVGLDVESRATLLDYTLELCRNDGIGVLWATHLLDEVHDQAWLVVLHRGVVTAQGEVPEVLAQTGTGSVAEAFAALTAHKAPGKGAEPAQGGRP